MTCYFSKTFLWDLPWISTNYNYFHRAIMSTRRRRKKPIDDAKTYILSCTDKDGFMPRFIDRYKGKLQKIPWHNLGILKAKKYYCWCNGRVQFLCVFRLYIPILFFIFLPLSKTDSDRSECDTLQPRQDCQSALSEYSTDVSREVEPIAVVD